MKMTQTQYFRIRKAYEHSLRPHFHTLYSEVFPEDKCTLLTTGNYSGWVKQRAWDMFKGMVVYRTISSVDHDDFIESLHELRSEVFKC